MKIFFSVYFYCLGHEHLELYSEKYIYTGSVIYRKPVVVLSSCRIDGAIKGRRRGFPHFTACTTVCSKKLLERSRSDQLSIFFRVAIRAAFSITLKWGLCSAYHRVVFRFISSHLQPFRSQTNPTCACSQKD